MYKHISVDKKEYVISKQILRLGTSICANIKEGLQAQSDKDFLNKMNVALKEAAETEYWIELLKATGYLNEILSYKLLTQCKEVNRILTSIVKTTKNKLGLI